MVHDKFLKLQDDGLHTIFLAQVAHCIMHDEKCFSIATKMVNSQIEDGVLKNVSFYPKPLTDEISNS